MIGNAIAGLYGIGVAPEVNSYESIATTTVGSGGSSSISFTSISSTYTHLQLRIIGRSLSPATTQISIRFNSDSGGNYSEHQIRGDGSAVSTYGGASVSAVQTGILPGTNQSANVFGVLVVDILDYKDTNKYKTVRMLTGYDNNGSGSIGLYSAGWRSTSAITAIEAFVSGYNFVQYTQIALYGIKGA
jgi:hypothetical protein